MQECVGVGEVGTDLGAKHLDTDIAAISGETLLYIGTVARSMSCKLLHRDSPRLMNENFNNVLENFQSWFMYVSDFPCLFSLSSIRLA